MPAANALTATAVALCTLIPCAGNTGEVTVGRDPSTVKRSTAFGVVHDAVTTIAPSPPPLLLLPLASLADVETVGVAATAMGDDVLATVLFAKRNPEWSPTKTWLDPPQAATVLPVKLPVCPGRINATTPWSPDVELQLHSRVLQTRVLNTDVRR
jgi:hypothetical protein